MSQFNLPIVVHFALGKSTRVRDIESKTEASFGFMRAALHTRKIVRKVASEKKTSVAFEMRKRKTEQHTVCVAQFVRLCVCLFFG